MLVVLERCWFSESSARCPEALLTINTVADDCEAMPEKLPKVECACSVHTSFPATNYRDKRSNSNTATEYWYWGFSGFPGKYAKL